MEADDETGYPIGFTEDQMAPHGDSLKDLKKDFEYMRQAFKEKPIDEKQLLNRTKKCAPKIKPDEEMVSMEEFLKAMKETE